MHKESCEKGCYSLWFKCLAGFPLFELWSSSGDAQSTSVMPLKHQHQQSSCLGWAFQLWKSWLPHDHLRLINTDNWLWESQSLRLSHLKSHSTIKILWNIAGVWSISDLKAQRYIRGRSNCSLSRELKSLSWGEGVVSPLPFLYFFKVLAFSCCFSPLWKIF